MNGSAAQWTGRVSIVACVVLVGSLTAPAGGVAGAAARAFKTPSGNIVCQTLEDSLRDQVECAIRSGLKGAHLIPCGLGDPVTNRVELAAPGRATRVLCAGDPGPLDASWHPSVLAYGNTLRFGRISCSSRRSGLTCRNRAGHGFFLSRASWRLF